MYITCLDVEGVLVPEIWIAFAEASGIPELKKTTRDEPDYDKLMNWRLGILKEHGLGLKEDVYKRQDQLFFITFCCVAVTIVFLLAADQLFLFLIAFCCVVVSTFALLYTCLLYTSRCV